MTTSLENLQKPESKKTTLFLELAVWLHLLGKFSSQFLEDQLKGRGKEYKSFYKKASQNFKDVYDDNWVQGLWGIQSIRKVLWPGKFSQFSEKHDDYNFAEGMSPVALCVDAHGRGSGTDKSVQEDAVYTQQNRPIYQSTAFGYESRVDEIKLNSQRDKLLDFLSQKLKDLKNNPDQIEEIRKDIIATLKKELTLTVSDTRRPINDISLWSQTASTVGFFKPALAKNILLNRWHNPFNEKAQYHWRYLRIGLNGLDFWGRSNRIGDLLSRQELFIRALDKVTKLLEVDYCLGMEVYRDEIGSLFLVPDEPDNLLELDQNIVSTLKEKATAVIKDALEGEAIPELELSGRSRNLFIAGKILSEPVPEPSADTDSLVSWWISPNQKTQPICSICGLRPQGYEANQDPKQSNLNYYKMKAIDRQQCCICMNRLSGRSKNWVTKTLNRTIWMDEIADLNRRVALIVGCFDLENWLGGLLISTMTIPLLDNIDSNGHTLNDLQKELESGFQKNTPLNDKAAFPIFDNFLRKEIKDQKNNLNELYNFLITNEDLDQIPQPNKLVKLTLALIRKPPSFARISRVWETTRKFWQDILPTNDDVEISESEAGRIVGLAGPRLKIEGELHPIKKDDILGFYHTYELLLNHTKISVVWVSENDSGNGYFITSENLVVIAYQLGKNLPEREKGESVIDYQKHLHKWAAETLRKEIVGTLIIEEPTGYGAKNEVWGTTNVNNVLEIVDNTYSPIIPILAEPRTFMALVPADRALEVVKTIKAKYEREMGKVRNRLPLQLGIVFAHYKTPLRIILDAGRRMLNQVFPAKDWYVKKKDYTRDASVLAKTLKDDLHFNVYVCLKLTRNNHQAVWYTPLKMGDGSTDDEWYPYVFIQCDKDGKPPKGRKRMFEAPCPWNLDGEEKPQFTWLVHAADLQEGDVIYFTPATLDFQWLDTSARRFEIVYDDNKGHRLDISQRPYLLDELETLQQIWDTLSSYLTVTQVHALRELIESKRTEWKTSEEATKLGETQGENSGVFWKFCRDTIVNTEWQKIDGFYPWGTDKKQPEQEWLVRWTDYAVRGWLNDVIELYMQILKKKPE